MRPASRRLSAKVRIFIEHLEKTFAGTITDRDIACRCFAEGKDFNSVVSDVMSPNPSCCGPNDDVRDVERVMSERQVRRVPIVDQSGCCVGIVAQTDLARAEDRGLSDREVGRVDERVSEPTGCACRSALNLGVRRLAAPYRPFLRNSVISAAGSGRLTRYPCMMSHPLDCRNAF